MTGMVGLPRANSVSEWESSMPVTDCKEETGMVGFEPQSNMLTAAARVLPASNPCFAAAHYRSQTAGMVGFEPTIERLGTTRLVH